MIFLVVLCFDWKIGVFQQTFAKGFSCILLISIYVKKVIGLEKGNKSRSTSAVMAANDTF